MALGFILVYNASGAFNFSHGESVTLAVTLLLQKLVSRTLERSGLLVAVFMMVAFGMVVRGLVHVFWVYRRARLRPSVAMIP